MKMTYKEEPVTELELMRTLFDGKWRFDVVRSLCDGPQRLSTLERLVPLASKKMLIDTLHSLDDLGWILRIDLSKPAKRVEYCLAAQWAQRLCSAIQKVTS
jgi:DNA-binding HxlR family transcriptional regulator